MRLIFNFLLYGFIISMMTEATLSLELIGSYNTDLDFLFLVPNSFFLIEVTSINMSSSTWYFFHPSAIAAIIASVSIPPANKCI